MKREVSRHRRHITHTGPQQAFGGRGEKRTGIWTSRSFLHDGFLRERWPGDEKMDKTAKFWVRRSCIS